MRKIHVGIAVGIASLVVFGTLAYYGAPSQQTSTTTSTTIESALPKCEYVFRGDLISCLPKGSYFTKTAKHYEIFTVQYRVDGVRFEKNLTSLTLYDGSKSETRVLNVSNVMIGNIISVTYNKTFSDFEIFATTRFELVNEKECRYVTNQGDIAYLATIVYLSSKDVTNWREPVQTCLATIIKSGERIWHAATPLDTIPILVKIIA